MLLKGEWFRSIVTQEGKFWKEIEKKVRGVVEQQEEGITLKEKDIYS